MESRSQFFDANEACSAVSMSPFSSPYPAVSLPCTSFYEHIQQNDGTHPADRAVCTDGITGETLSRTAFRKQALELASSLRRVDEAGLLPIHKGSIVTVFSPNSLLYTLLIVALVSGSILCFHLFVTLI